jgi:hypothetical protein
VFASDDLADILGDELPHRPLSFAKQSVRFLAAALLRRHSSSGFILLRSSNRTVIFFLF